MTLSQIENSKVRGKDHCIEEIDLHNGVPILIKGTVQDGNANIDVYWNAKTGLCYIGQDEMEPFNLIPTT